MHGAGARCSESNFSEKIGNFLIQSEIFGFELWSNFNAKAKVISEFRGVVAGSASAGGATPDFGRSVNPRYLNQGGRLCPPNNTGTLEFTDLPTALVMASQGSHAYLLVCELCNNCELVIEILK